MWCPHRMFSQKMDKMCSRSLDLSESAKTGHPSALGDVVSVGWGMLNVFEDVRMQRQQRTMDSKLGILRLQNHFAVVEPEPGSLNRLVVFGVFHSLPLQGRMVRHDGECETRVTGLRFSQSVDDARGSTFNQSAQTNRQYPVTPVVGLFYRDCKM